MNAAGLHRQRFAPGVAEIRSPSAMVRAAHALVFSVTLLSAGCAAGGCAHAPPPLNLGGITQTQIKVGNFVYDARVAGPVDGEVVILLHGFPETSLQWRAQLRALAGAGYRAVAPDQRGYSAGARPTNDEGYVYAQLVDDVTGFADALSAKEFHLVGHDWGAVVAWGVAAKAPTRVKSLTIFSIPHPDAFAAALSDESSCQYEASSYFDTFTDVGAADKMLALNAFVLRNLVYGDLHPEAIDGYLNVLDEGGGLDPALGWYRANVKERQLTAPAVGPIEVDTLYVWSDADTAVCRETAEATVNFVRGKFRFEVFGGIDHWIPERAPDRANALLLSHIRGSEHGDRRARARRLGAR